MVNQLNGTAFDFANKVYGAAASEEGGDGIKQFPILLIITLIGEAIQLLISLSSLFHGKSPEEIRQMFKNLNIFQRLQLRRAVRQAIKKHNESVGEYSEFLQDGIRSAFASGTDAEITQAIKDFGDVK